MTKNVLDCTLKTSFAGALADYRKTLIGTFYLPSGENDAKLVANKARVLNIYRECPGELKPGLFLIIEVTMGQHEPLRDVEGQEKSEDRLNKWLQYMGENLAKELTAPPDKETRQKFDYTLKLVAGFLKTIQRAEVAKRN